MKLYGTPLSHFTRKVRILLDLYSTEYEFIDIGNVAQNNEEAFQNNPLMKVPVLVDGDNKVFDSDNIAMYLVRKIDQSDKYNVLTREVMDLNIRAIINGAMLEEVKVILARRTSVPTDQYTFFKKSLDSISKSLVWLESHATSFTPQEPTYREFHLLCLWDHLNHYKLVPLNYPKLEVVIEKLHSIKELKDQYLKQD